mmetsp:Transcript_11470/g.42805  ORF Transcript_11470/g.42805 Transcript_11470/m.42805 type:complete len:278 (-) Transcript_11470:597-1430(-)
MAGRIPTMQAALCFLVACSWLVSPTSTLVYGPRTPASRRHSLAGPAPRVRCSMSAASQDDIIWAFGGGGDAFAEALDSNRVVIFRFFAPWCRACRGMKASFGKVAQRLIDEGQPVSFYDVNVADKPSKELVLELEIRALPYVAVYVDGGRPVHAAPCGMSKVPALETKLDSILRNLPQKEASDPSAEKEAESSASTSEAAPSVVRSSKRTARSSDLAEWNRFRFVIASTRAFLNSQWNARLQDSAWRKAAANRLSNGQVCSTRALRSFEAIQASGRS